MILKLAVESAILVLGLILLLCPSLSHACPIPTSYSFSDFDVYFDGELTDFRTDKGTGENLSDDEYITYGAYLTYDVQRVHKGHLRKGKLTVRMHVPAQVSNVQEFTDKYGDYHRIAFEYFEEEGEAIGHMKHVQRVTPPNETTRPAPCQK